jgi:hypothetical protein
MESNWIGYIDTLFSYYLPGVDVSSLSDKRWVEMYKQLMNIRKMERSSGNE